MKNFLQSLLSVAREGSIAVAVSVTMLSASVAAAAPTPPPAGIVGVGHLENDGSLTGHKWSDALFNGIVSATLWTVGAPFPEKMSTGERIARYGAGIGLAVAGGVLATVAVTVTAPVWAAGLGVAAGVGLILTGMHYGFGAWISDHFGNDGDASPVIVSSGSGTGSGSLPTSTGTVSVPGTTGGSNTGRTTPTRPIKPGPGRIVFGSHGGAGTHR